MKVVLCLSLSLTLLAGSCQSAKHQASAQAVSCAAAVKTGKAMVIERAYVQARLRGRGAEGCITRSALDVYCDQTCGLKDFRGPEAADPGPICLYRCAGYTVGRLQFDSAGGGLAAYLSGTLVDHKGKAMDWFNEYDTLGPGVPAAGDGHQVPLLIVEATTSA